MQLGGQARGISHSPEVFHNQHIISVCQVLRSFSIVVASESHVAATNYAMLRSLIHVFTTSKKKKIKIFF